MKICVYCSASSALDKRIYEAGANFGKMLAERGHSLVYGGFDKGLMGAVARAAAEGGAEVTGVIPQIFASDGAAEYCARVINVGTMSERKARMEAEADAFAVLAGGIGTFDEFFEALVLKSLGQLDKPMAVYNMYGSMSGLEALLKKNVEEGFLNERALALAPFCESAEEVFGVLEQCLR